ncbi:50S ribosomal protein L18Ae [Pyrobaculum ferrireducens]|uniref:Large ribosomal subunit protein eL20 n=1 Tax=Pyrobaculum ferrireducens TaxID=1104324 RepID=G7VER0_9CREN|nr:50S ribosomal protein L18Ae [Pyrobaculum ferrireducens]AET32876.1 ribosomal protein LX [Pyrobaculum ferrireducens]
MPKIYRVVGEATTGMKFRLEVVGEKPYDAVEKAYSLIGSRHKLSRTQIRIREVSVISPEEARSEDVKILMNIDKVIRY